jgi:hypothetical protein
MTIRSTCLAALLIAAALGAGCDVHVGENGLSVDVAHGRAGDEWRRSYTVNKGGTLEVVNTNGAIVVDAGTGPQVEIVATRQVRAGSDEEARELLKGVEIKEEATPARVAVRTTTASGLTFGRRSVNVEYRLKVPAGLHLSVKTENGGISLHNVDGTIVASTTNGGVRGTNLAGAVSARIVNGGISMDVARVTGPIELESVNGGIRLDVPADLDADVDAQAVNGGVSTDDALPVSAADRSRTRIRGTLNRGGVRIAAHTVNGGVRIGARSAETSDRSVTAESDEGGPVRVER